MVGLRLAAAATGPRRARSGDRVGGRVPRRDRDPDRALPGLQRGALGHDLRPELRAHPGVLEDPIYAKHGILALEYIPRHIFAIFLRSWNFVDDPPFFQP